MINRSALFAFGLALTTACWPGISGMATTPRWVVVMIGLPLLLFFGERIRWRALYLPGLALVAWLAVTGGLAAHPPAAVEPLIFLVMGAGAFALGTTLGDTKPLVLGAAVGLTISSLVAVAQWLGVSPIEAKYFPAGLFYSSDRLAACVVLVFADAVALRMWWALPGLAPAFLLAQSRASVVALIVMLTISQGQHSRMLGWVLAVIGLAAISVPIAGGWRTNGVNERLDLWQDTWNALTFWGHGLGSFTDTFPQYAQRFDIAHARPEHPHNEFLLMAYEGGVLGIALAVAFCIGVWRASAREWRPTLAALGVLAFLGMPFHDPATLALGALLAGHAVACGRPHPCRLEDTRIMGIVLAGIAAARRIDLRDPIDDGGSALRARLAAA